MGFYDDLADSYDTITATTEREESAAAFVDELTHRFTVQSAVDAACGTGLYALALARRGISVVGVDLSAGMLDKARAAAEDAGLRAEWICAPLQELGAHIEGPRDAVLCMGNSLPHLLEEDDLDAALAGMTALLAPDGVLVLHLLNYVRIVSEKDRIIGATRAGETEYLRFYDFLPGRVRFNILEIEWEGNDAQTQLSSTELRPYFADDLTATLTRHGLTKIETFGDLAFSPFTPQQSDSLLITAQR